LIGRIGLRQPVNRTALTTAEAIKAAQEVGYPVVIRPSYVLGGRGMTIVRDEEHMIETLDQTDVFKISGDDPVLIDQYLQSAIEVDVDAIADGKSVFIAGIMEHIEEAGVHSGDSACSIPPWSLEVSVIKELERQTAAMARELDVVGLMNVQFAIQDRDIYVLEVNPRASRTVPFVAKAVGLPIAAIAARVMAGESLASFKLTPPRLEHVAVKEAVLPFARFPGVDTLLGPEMKSTGEVMGLDQSFERAFAKSQIAAGLSLPDSGTVFVSVRDSDKDAIVEAVRRLIALGFKIIATGGTASFLKEKGLGVARINKVYEGRPHIVDAMKNGEVQLVFNTTEGGQAIKDSLSIRRTALAQKIPYYTTVAGSLATAQAIGALRAIALDVAPLQAYGR
jgi:carbamoyl-phosphate synthase large subunit